MLWDMDETPRHRHRAPAPRPLMIDTLELQQVLRHTIPAAAHIGALACLRIHAAAGDLSVTATDGRSFARMIVPLPSGAGDLGPCLVRIQDAHRLVNAIGPRASARPGRMALLTLAEVFSTAADPETGLAEPIGYELMARWDGHGWVSVPVDPADGYPDVFQLAASTFVTGTVR